MNERFTTRRLAIVNSLVELIKSIDGTGRWSIDLAGCVYPRMSFWDEISEFPSIHLAAGHESREYLPAGQKNRFLAVTVRCYVEAEDPTEVLERLLADIELVIEDNSRLAYVDPLGGTEFTHDILVTSIDTDEGALAPLGVGEIVLQVRY